MPRGVAREIYAINPSYPQGPFVSTLQRSLDLPKAISTSKPTQSWVAAYSDPSIVVLNLKLA